MNDEIIEKVQDGVYDDEGEFDPTKDRLYQRLMRTPINKLTTDDIAYLYTVHFSKVGTGYYDNGKQITQWYVPTKYEDFYDFLNVNKRNYEDEVKKTYDFIHSLSFPLLVYRGLNETETKEVEKGNFSIISGGKGSLSWTVDPKIYFENNSKFRNVKTIVKASISSNVVQNEWTVVNYMLYSARNSSVYPEYEITLRPLFKNAKLNDLELVNKEELRKQLYKQESVSMLKDEVSKNTLRKRQEWARELDTKGSMGSFYSFSPMGEDYLNEEPDNSHLQPVPEDFEIRLAPWFEKKYNKMFPMLSLNELSNYLKTTPPDASLGAGLYKIRIRDKLSNKGQSGGYRIIYVLYTEDKECWIFDAFSKSDKENISRKELMTLKRLAKKS